MVQKIKMGKCIYLTAAVYLYVLVVHRSQAYFNPVDNYLIVCGSSRNVSFQNRVFVSDSQPSSFSLTSRGDAVVSDSRFSGPSPLFQSLRIFRTKASYEFDIKQKGRHWIRLYFCALPISISNYDLASTPITVVADEFVLLNNFTLNGSNSSYLFKEYSINVTSDKLTLNFIPIDGSVVFVNAIEVVSIPDDLIPDQAYSLSPYTTVNGLSAFALETMYRLNMGGPLITPQNDTLGRYWQNDEKYLFFNTSAINVSVDPGSVHYPVIFTPEIAPNWVYATAEAMGDANVTNLDFNITWVFPVDPDFSYFIRLHFCDIVSKAMNTLVFNVYINSDSAISSLDLSARTGVLSTPFFKDFVSNYSSDSKTISVSVGPEESDITNAILNGLEIMKISNFANSLDGISSVEGILSGSHSKKTQKGIIIGSIVGSFALLAIAVLSCCISVAKKGDKSSHSWLPLPLSGNSHTITKTSMTSLRSGMTSISVASSHLGRIFTFQEIMDSTNKFDERLLLGVGGFGKVYKGTLDDGTKVAVKRGNPRSEQGLAEFHTEIEMLSKLRHRHLVSLIGYCDERSEMILVYEYMANGPLRSHLYGTDLPPLSWKQRLEICIGAARGLHYLHTGAAQSIIHRDVKTTNILLDENLVAKVADFGLSKTGPSFDQTHVSTAVKGSFGYLDPEYFRRQQLTEKSDVYSFGVVLMEVLCTRPALNPVLPREQVNIAEWAMIWQKRGMLDQIMDSRLVGKINPASLRKFGETAEKCLADQGIDRPTMGDILWNLEYALQLEETCGLSEPDENSTNHIVGISLTPSMPFESSVNMVDQVNPGMADDNLEDVTTSAVFSQLVNPRGR